MQVVINRGIRRVVGRPFIYSALSTSFTDCNSLFYDRWQFPTSFGVLIQGFISGTACQHVGQCLLGSHVQRLRFCTETVKRNEEAVNEVYLKMLKSLESENMPPNAWRDSLLENCKNREDLKLVFLMLENLRIFRLSKQRLYSNYTQQISLKLVSACIRADAPELGMKTLWKHNVYGLTPCLGAAHSLLLYSKDQTNAGLMEEIMRTMEKNSIQPQPTTADIVFSICNDTESWELMCKYANKFLKNGVKLHRGAYDIWISFAAKIGNVQRVWKIQELRSNAGLKHTVPSAIACAKAHLLKWQPQDAAEIILALYEQENLSESKKKWIYDELQQLVDEWPAEVIARRDKVHRKAFSSELKDSIAIMFNNLMTMGLNFSLSVEDRFCLKSIRSLDETVSC